jgi:hypothetical protein
MDGKNAVPTKWRKGEKIILGCVLAPLHTVGRGWGGAKFAFIRTNFYFE